MPDNEHYPTLPRLPIVQTLDDADPRWRQAYDLRQKDDWETYHGPFVGKKLTMANACKGCWHSSCCGTFESWAINRRSGGKLVGCELEVFND